MISFSRDKMEKMPPEDLNNLIANRELKNYELTFAAEILGRCAHQKFKSTLLNLLGHSSSVVREGAIYGLLNYLIDSDETIVNKFIDMANQDPSPIIRELLLEELEWRELI